ncbi:hypothetical protein Tco_1409727, partial [Tanacetum coccineum]
MLATCPHLAVFAVSWFMGPVFTLWGPTYGFDGSGYWKDSDIYSLANVTALLMGPRPMHNGHGSRLLAQYFLDLQAASTVRDRDIFDNFKSLQYRPYLGPKDTETLKDIQPIKGIQLSSIQGPSTNSLDTRL